MILPEAPTRDGSGGVFDEWLQDFLTDPEKLAKVDAFLGVAKDVGCTPGQLALAWTASNPNVSSVILGARHVDQLNENLGALDVIAALTEEQKAQIDEIFS